MKFLVIVQDLRISGTSEGIVSRSFLSKLRIAYPESVIDVVYLKQYASEDRLDLLPVSSIQSHVLNLKIPFYVLWWNKIFWRLFHSSLKESHIVKVYTSYIAKINYQKYDHIFIRSGGLNHEMLLATKNLPILQHAIINFHDPYPLFWYAGSNSALTNLELFRMKEMHQVVSQAKTCMSSATLMSKDMEYVYGSRIFFHTLPHQYCDKVFDLSDNNYVIKKGKKVTISYHGAIQFGRDIQILLDAYQELVSNNTVYKENTEFVLRLKGIDLVKLAAKYADTSNIKVLGSLNFSNSCNEQMNEADINIILENGPLYCNILVGKAPFLAATKKPILSISPERSELRRIIKDKQYVASCLDLEEIKQKLENLIINRMNSNEPVFPFGDYFSNLNFKEKLDEVLC